MNIFLDFDGVLVRSRNPDRTFIWNRHLERDLGIPSALLRKIFEPSQWDQVITGRLDFRMRLHELLQDQEDVEDFVRYWLEHDLNWNNQVVGLARELKELGHSLYIASNQDTIRGRHIASQKLIRDTFRNVYFSSELGVRKPETEFFQKIQEEVGGALTLVDDDRSNLEEAASCGWKTFYFNPDLDSSVTITDLRRELMG